MSKAIFRYLRGELNGFYLQAIHNTLNNLSEDIRKFFYTFSSMQFEYGKMDEDKIYGLGRFAGVYLPRLSSGEGSGSFRLTESKVVTVSEVPEERSERGLFNKETETFDFVHLETDFQSTDDINNEASTNDKSSLVGSEELAGYIPSSATDVITDEGDIDTSKVVPVSTPPTDEAYSDFYSNDFLFISEPLKVVTNIDTSLFVPLYKVMQYIRYNGESIESLCNIISILCPNGFIKVKSINKTADAPYFTVVYTYDSSIYVDNRLQRIATLLYVVNLKFPQFVMVEGD